MDVISEMMGVPGGRPGRGTPPRRPGRAPRAGRPRRARAPAWRPALDLVVYYADMVEQRQEAADRRPHQRAARGGDRRRPADRRGDHRLPLPDGGGRQRDDDQAARARALPPDPAPRAARPGLRRPGQADDLVVPWIEETLRYDTSSQMLARHLLEDVELARHGRAGGLQAAARARLRQPRRAGLLRPGPLRHLPATRTRSASCSASAVAGTSASAPTWPGSRPRSRCARWSAGSAGSRSTTTPASACTRSTSAASPRCRSRMTRRADGQATPSPDRRPAVVTGASSGIGAATALTLAAAGHPVALGARRTDKCEERRRRDPASRR